MKHLILLFIVFAEICLNISAQTITPYPGLLTPSSEVVKSITVDPSMTKGLELDMMVFEKLRAEYPASWTLSIPGFNNEEIVLELERFEAFPATVTVGIHSDKGFEEMDYVPRIKTYRVVGGTGTIVLMVDHVIGTFQWNESLIEIKKVKDSHVIFDVNDTIESRTFECGVVDGNTTVGNSKTQLETSTQKSLAGCVEIAVDIDFYTYSTFSSALNATDWALALMSGVSQIYTQELGNLMFLQTTYVHIWQSADPMSNLTNQASEMLATFRSVWLTDPNLSAIPRDETHLLTKRGDTGTGGIAYLNAVCSSWAYGFSGYLSGTTSYNISSYSWNLNVVAHEMGHNFGSNHTQWCGWPNGPIDNCGDLEGPCGGYTNNPQAQVGTIMSYCHAIAGGSVTLNFHQTVKAFGIQPSVNSGGGCYAGCDGYVAPVCSILDIQQGAQLSCNPTTNSYTQQVIITYENPPSAGLIDVNGTLHVINFSPQTISLFNVPADGLPVDVNAFFNADVGCALNKVSGFVERTPCCASIRLQYVNPNSNVIKVVNTSACDGYIDNWGVYSNGVFNTFNDLASPGQSLFIAAGAEMQFAWTGWGADPLNGDLQLYSPAYDVMDYIQWGAPGNVNEAISSQLGLWEIGTFVNALPPFNYIGTGGFGAAFWSGANIPCNISDVSVVSNTLCDPTTSMYSIDFSVSYSGSPAIGGLVVNNTTFPLAPSGSTYTLTVPAIGSWLNLDVAFESDAACSFFLGNAIFGPPSCSVLCSTDVNADGVTSVADVLAILSEFGCTVNCQYDVNGDSSITVADVLDILAAFGEICV